MFHRRFQDNVAAAIDAHGKWRLKLRTALRTRQLDFSPEIAGDDRCCAFGTWLHGPEIDAATRQTPAWTVVARLHREFHEVAYTVADLVARGRYAEAEALMSGEYLHRSTRLLAALQKWHVETALDTGH